jgi:hypothetical protein
MQFHVCASRNYAKETTEFGNPVTVALGREIYRNIIHSKSTVRIQLRPDFNWFEFIGTDTFECKVNQNITEFYKGRADDYEKTEIRGRLYLFDVNGCIYVLWKRASNDVFYGFSVTTIEVSTCGKCQREPLRNWNIKLPCTDMDQKFINWLQHS